MPPTCRKHYARNKCENNDCRNVRSHIDSVNCKQALIQPWIHRLHACIHKKLTLVPILSQSNSVYTLTSYSCDTYFNILSSLQIFQLHICKHLSSLPYVANYMLPTFHRTRFDDANDIQWRAQIRQYSLFTFINLTATSSLLSSRITFVSLLLWRFFWHVY
jgi:hypothetical protein